MSSSTISALYPGDFKPASLKGYHFILVHTKSCRDCKLYESFLPRLQYDYSNALDFHISTLDITYNPELGEVFNLRTVPFVLTISKGLATPHPLRNLGPGQPVLAALKKIIEKDFPDLINTMPVSTPLILAKETPVSDFPYAKGDILIFIKDIGDYIKAGEEHEIEEIRFRGLITEFKIKDFGIPLQAVVESCIKKETI